MDESPLSPGSDSEFGLFGNLEEDSEEEPEDRMDVTEWMAVYKNIDTQSDDLTLRDIEDGKTQTVCLAVFAHTFGLVVANNPALALALLENNCCFALHTSHQNITTRKTQSHPSASH